MSRFDDRLTRELERAARPAEPAGVFDEIDRRRGRRAVMRRVQTAMLATVVFAGSIGGVLVLNRAFRGEGGTTPALPPAQNGLIVVSFGDDAGTHLYLQNPDDPTWDPRDHQLTNDVSRDTAPAVSPDGRTVAFVREELQLPMGQIAVWVVGIDGTSPHLLVSDATDPAWSPDGDRIVFVRPGGDAGGVYTVRSDGSDLQLLSGDGDASSPSWSPDGGRIAVAIRSGSNSSSIETIDVETRETTLISPAFWDVGSPSWSPDGRYLTFAHGGGIVVLTLDGGDVTELTTTHTAEEAASADLAYMDSQPTWSPDGEWIAFERFFGPSEFFVYAGRPDVLGVLRRVGLGGDPSWSVAQPPAPEPSGTSVEPTATLLVSIGGPSGDQALLEGPLSLSNGCVGIGTGDTFTYLIWPAGSTIVSGGGGVTVKDGSGTAVVSLGDTIRMGGGIDSLASAEETVVGGIPDGCREPGVHYWYVGEIELVTSPRSPSESTVVVPNVIGLSLDDARTTLESSGSVVGRVEVTTGGYTVAAVVEQDPAAGTQVATGSAVDLLTGPKGSA